MGSPSDSDSLMSVICFGRQGCLLWHDTLRRSLWIVDFEVHVVTFTKVCFLAAEV